MEIWRANAARWHHGVCDDCDAATMVARQLRARRFQCLACFTARPTGSKNLRQLVRRLRRDAAAAAKSTSKHQSRLEKRTAA